MRKPKEPALIDPGIVPVFSSGLGHVRRVGDNLSLAWFLEGASLSGRRERVLNSRNVVPVGAAAAAVEMIITELRLGPRRNERRPEKRDGRDGHSGRDGA